MSFSTPIALFILFLLPYFAWIGWPRMPARSPQRLRRVISLGIRLLIITLLVLGLAGAQAVQAGQELAVVFLLDASDSISRDQAEKGENLIRESLRLMGAQEMAAVVIFGAEPLVERPMSELADLEKMTSVPLSLHTDIAAAIRLGLGLFPGESARRLVLISDGTATKGDTNTAAHLAAAANVPIDFVYLPRPAAGVEVSLLEVGAPAIIQSGDLVSLDVVVESTAVSSANLRVFDDQNLIHEETVILRDGTNNFSLRLPVISQEHLRYTVQIAAEGDTFFQNNELSGFIEVTGAPRILLMADETTPLADEGSFLLRALGAANTVVERITPQEMPSSLSDLSQFDGLILVNVNSRELSPREMENIQQYVRDLGGGLVVVGGPQSYGMGGYFQTPLEETLPVDMQITDEERFPSVSLVLVLDRSGSMEQVEGGVTKMQLAGEGAVRAVQLLHDFDEITIIPVDTQVSDQLGPLPAAERQEIIARIREIGAGGGGIYVRSGLEAAAKALEPSDKQVKHIVLLADGADAEEQNGVPDLIANLADGGVSVSTVSIGQGPDTPWLEEMAGLGHGRFHLTDRAANLPQIFAQETVAIQRNYLIEERFLPVHNNPSPIMAGIQNMPSLSGYVGTAPKQSAQVILATPMGDPLLAAWQYGLGRSVAWTSDATSRWAADWVTWEGFPLFWAQVVDWTLAADPDKLIEMAVTYEDDVARLSADIRDENLDYLNDLKVQANIIDPDGQVLALALTQNASGLYEAAFTPENEGIYLIRLSGSDRNGQSIAGQTIGWTMGYSPEYRNLNTSPQTLAALAKQTGGRDLSEASAEELATAVFTHDLPSQRARQPLWPWLVLVAALLLPVDVALRRLVISRHDLAQAMGIIRSRFFPKSKTVQEVSEPLSRLMEAKKRAESRTIREGPDQIPAEFEARVAEEGDPPSANPAETSEPYAPSSDEESSLAARLLRKKQERDDR